MPHDDFFEATLIEFTQWVGGKEKTIAEYGDFDSLPTNLINHFKNNSDESISLNQKKWNIVETSKDLRAHGKGIHIKLRLEPLP